MGRGDAFSVADSVPNINIRNRLRFFLCVCFADWTLEPSLLHAYVAMSLNKPLRAAFKTLVRIRRLNRGVTENELTSKGAFLQTFANGFATWVLQNIKSSRGQATAHVPHVCCEVLWTVGEWHLPFGGLRPVVSSDVHGPSMARSVFGLQRQDKVA